MKINTIPNGVKLLHISPDNKILLLQMFFITCMILSNIVGIKIVNIGPVATSVGIWLVPIAFLITDILAEVKGRKFVSSLIWSTVAILIFSFVFIKLSILAKPADRFIETNPAFVTVFNNSARIFIASIIAFVLSQFHDIWAFEFWKNKTHGKFLWLRNNLSTIVSQFIDTILFMFIAFYHISPQFDALFIWQLIIPYYILKIILALADTPFVYAGVRWLKK